jgi:EAL domain-containing protein (putative c-di-GMP-specific phosphodiesterase class I)
MYHAKQDGRGRVKLYDPSSGWRAELESRMSWVERIDDALAEDSLEIWAQPVRDLATDRVARYELLLRMVAPDGEIIMPSEFLPAAERLGRMGAIDMWVVSNAIDALAQPAAADLCFNVNLSGGGLADSGLVERIQALIQAAGVAPARLSFEITETSVIVDIAKAQEIIDRLHGVGGSFWLDDFGAGFSSFYYLKQLPVECLKIDGSFIRGMTANPRDQHLVRGIAELARGLGIKVAAESVETHEALELVRSLGIDFAQGYHIGLPRPLSEVLEER